MNVDPSTARLGLTDVAQTVANADTTRSRTFSNTLHRARRDTGHPNILDHQLQASATETAAVASKGEAPAARLRNESRSEAEIASTPPDSTLLADINEDGAVDVFDFGKLAAAYGSSDPDADLDGSGTVDEIDALILRRDFGRTANPEDRGAIESQGNPTVPTTADYNNDGRIDVFDFGHFTTAFAQGDPSADLFQDGTVDEIDLAIFKHLFNRST